jgi:hypothetical protein
MLLQSVLSPAPLLDCAPNAGPKPVWASRTPGSEPHARASGPCLGTELGFASPDMALACCSLAACYNRDLVDTTRYLYAP